MPRIFLTYSPEVRANYYREQAQAGLRALGELRCNEEPRPLTTAEVIEQARGCTVIVADRQTPGTAELFRALPDLVAFTRCAVDIRNVDVAAAGAEGILVTQASAGFMNSVAEWIVGVMIDLSRHISAAVHTYRSGGMPEPLMGRELRGATLGVIGYGQIGRRLCELGLGLSMQVCVFDPHTKVERPRVAQVSFEDLLARSDFVVCLATATPETENLIDEAALRRMRRGAYFVNASRGNLVDEAALASALEDGRIAGCAMDVGRDPDQMPARALTSHPRVIATPHIGGLTPEAVNHQAMETVRQVAEILKGRAPVGAVNAALATRLERLRVD